MGQEPHRAIEPHPHADAILGLLNAIEFIAASARMMAIGCPPSHPRVRETAVWAQGLLSEFVGERPSKAAVRRRKAMRTG